MPKKVKRGKKRASTERISINIKNILSNTTERAKRRQAPDIIRPLGKRPIEASAFDNQYRLQNPSVTYASTPLANMASLRDLIQAPSAPQVTGQLALRQQPPIANPNLILPQLRPSERAVQSQRALSPSYYIDMRSLTPPRPQSLSPQFLYEAQRQSQPQPNALPIVGRSLESIAENTSQRLVAEQMDQDSRDIARVPSPPQSARVPSPPRSERKRAPILKGRNAKLVRPAPADQP